MNPRHVMPALALVLVGCVQEPNIPRLGDQPITLTMVLSSTTFQIGKADTIRVIVTNTFTEPAQIRFNSNCQVFVTIRSAAGAAVVPSDGRSACAPLPTTLIVPAEGSVTQSFVWNGATKFLPPGSPTALPPGTYFISATLDGTNYSTLAPAIRVELVTITP